MSVNADAARGRRGLGRSRRRSEQTVLPIIMILCAIFLMRRGAESVLAAMMIGGDVLWRRVQNKRRSAHSGVAVKSPSALQTTVDLLNSFILKRPFYLGYLHKESFIA